MFELVKPFPVQLPKNARSMMILSQDDHSTLNRDTLLAWAEDLHSGRCRSGSSTDVESQAHVGADECVDGRLQQSSLPRFSKPCNDKKGASDLQFRLRGNGGRGRLAAM